MDNYRTDIDALAPYLEAVQSIGRGRALTIAVPAPWGNALVAAGPYSEYVEDDAYYGVKLAREIDAPYVLKIDVKDFSTPDPDECEEVVWLMLAIMRGGGIPYIGCMGGLGRTGTVLGVLVKTLLEASTLRLFGVPVGSASDPVKWVRQYYRREAIETTEQEEFVRNFNTRWLCRMARKLK